MQCLTLMVGLPGSGKTTFVRGLREKRPGVAVVSPDLIRLQLFGVVFDYAVEDEVWTITRALVQGHFNLRRSVILDATNLTSKRRAQWIDLAKEYGIPTGAIFINPPIETVRKQNRMRTGDAVVPEDVIDKMSQLLQAPKPEEGLHFIIEVRSVSDDAIQQAVACMDSAERESVPRQVFVQEQRRRAYGEDTI